MASVRSLIVCLSLLLLVACLVENVAAQYYGGYGYPYGGSYG